MSAQVVTANRLDDGLVVFLNEEKKWDADINQAVLINDKSTADQLMKELEQGDFPQQVVGPYLIDVEFQSNQVKPLKYRERIRTLGPTVRTDLGYQAGQ